MRAESAITKRGLVRLLRSKAARQLELYRDRLQRLECEYASHCAANRQQAARETRVSVESARALIRRLCREAELELPPEVSADD